MTTFSLILTLSFYFLYDIHIVLLLSLSITLIYVSLPKFICIILLFKKLSQERVVQITLLIFLTIYYFILLSLSLQ